jgi:hypothetical protein
VRGGSKKKHIYNMVDNVTSYIDIKHYNDNLTIKKDHVYIHGPMYIMLCLYTDGSNHDHMLYAEITQKQTNRKYRTSFEVSPIVYHVEKGDKLRLVIDKNEQNMCLYEAKLLISTINK